MNDRIAAAYAEFEKADHDWHAALVAAFGKEAGDARYEPRGKGDNGSALEAIWMARVGAWQRLHDAKKAA